MTTVPRCATGDCDRTATHWAELYDGSNPEPIHAVYCGDCAVSLKLGGEKVGLLWEPFDQVTNTRTGETTPVEVAFTGTPWNIEKRPIRHEEIVSLLRDDGSDIAIDLELWAESDLAEGRHSLAMDAHVAASSIRRKIADLIEQEAALR